MNRRRFVRDLGAAGMWLQSGLAPAAAAGGKPNIVLILADDLGYGDLSCYGATKVTTPNIDRLARGGVLFTDAHAPSAVCTPSRYAVLTGRYCWRTQLKVDALFGHDPLLIEDGRVTVAALLKSAGYSTACIGKWHLGFGRDYPDWNGELKPGPLEVGFDYFRVPGHQRAGSLRLRGKSSRGRPRSARPHPARTGQQSEHDVRRHSSPIQG